MPLFPLSENKQFIKRTLRFYLIMSDITKELHQGADEKKRLEFEEKLKQIALKYDRWFSGHTNKDTGDKPDKIQNYFRYFQNHEGLTQLYIKDGMPIEVDLDCREAFKATFKA